MKKILIGLVVIGMVLAAGAVQAQTIVKNDALQYDIMMDWQMQYIQRSNHDIDPEIEADDLEFRNWLVYQLGNGWRAFGRLDWAADKAVNSTPGRGADYGIGRSRGIQFEEAWLGVGYKEFDLFIGDTANQGLYWGVEESWEDPNSFGTSAFSDKFDDDLIQLQGKGIGGIFSFILSHELKAEGTTTEDNANTILYAAVDLMGKKLHVDGIYQTVDDDDNNTVMGIAASYDFGFLAIAADYSKADNDSETGGVVYNAVVTVPVNKWTFNGGIIGIQPDEDGVDDIMSWYVNANFQPVRKVTFLVEISDSDEEDYDMMYLAGLRIQF